MEPYAFFVKCICILSKNEPVLSGLGSAASKPQLIADRVGKCEWTTGGMVQATSEETWAPQKSASCKDSDAELADVANHK